MGCEGGCHPVRGDMLLHHWDIALLAECGALVARWSIEHGTPAECSTASHDGSVKQRSGVYVAKSHS
jgi:hypothetical protein